MDDWEHLGQAVEERRLALGLSARAAAAQAQMNRATWASLEDGGRRLSRHLWSAVEKVLLWEPGSFARVLAGGEPTPTGQAEDSPAEPLDLEAEIDRVARLNIPARTKLALTKRLIELAEQTEAERKSTKRNGKAS